MFSFSIRRRDLAWMVALVFVVSAVWVARGDLAAGGTDPFVGDIDLVYVAVGTNYPDALGAGPGAAVSGAPIVLVPPNPPLDSSTSAELIRLNPTRLIIIGGNSAISLATENAIKALLPDALVSRLAGSNRYETNTMLTSSVYPIYEWVAVPGAAFAPELSTSVVLVDTDGYVSTSDDLLFAAIDLPHHSTVEVMNLNGYDMAGASVALVRIPTVVGPPLTLGSISIPLDSVGAVFEGTSVSGTTAVIDNDNYSYMLVVTLDGPVGEAFLRSVHVEVRLGSSGP